MCEDSSPSFSKFKNWATQFKCGCSRLEANVHERCPNTSISLEIIKKLHDMELDNCQIKVHEIIEAMSISKKCVRHILQEELQMKMLRARWVQWFFTADRKCVQNVFQNIESFWSILIRTKWILCISLLWMQLVPVDARVKTTVKAVDTRLLSAKEGKLSSISRKAMASLF